MRRVLIGAAVALGALGVGTALAYSALASSQSAQVIRPNLATPAVFVPNRVWFCNTLRNEGGLAHLVERTQADPSVENLLTLKIATVNAPIRAELAMAAIYRDVMTHTHPAAVRTGVTQVQAAVPC